MLTLYTFLTPSWYLFEIYRFTKKKLFMIETFENLTVGIMINNISVVFIIR